MPLAIAQLEKALAYRFRDSGLLERALTHRSCGARNNERLEFLGDSILNHIIAEALFYKFKSVREGGMSRMRASLVKGETLAQVAAEIDLGSYIRLGPGEMRSGGHRRASILADTLEAIIGACLLDSDVERCRQLVMSLFATRLELLSADTLAKDSKTQLQEYLQSRGKALPDYQLDQISGAEHEKEFRVRCDLPEFSLSYSGSGSSRRKAEQMAAGLALAELLNRG